MKLTVEPFSAYEATSMTASTFDQLTAVRRYVREQVNAHKESAEGEPVDLIQVEVYWGSGEVDTLVFDTLVGYPIEPVKDWLNEWIEEMNG